MSAAFAGPRVAALAAVPLKIPHMACPTPREPHKLQTAPAIKIRVCELSAPPGTIKIMVFELQAAFGTTKTLVFHALN